MENGITASGEIRYELDPSTREKMSLKKKGANNPNYGKPRDPETVKKISDGQAKRWAKIKVFNEAKKYISRKGSWWKLLIGKYNVILRLIECTDKAAVYEGTTSKDKAYITYKVKCIDDEQNEISKKFDRKEDAIKFYNTLVDAGYEYLLFDADKTVKVLAIPKNILPRC